MDRSESRISQSEALDLNEYDASPAEGRPNHAVPIENNSTPSFDNTTKPPELKRKRVTRACDNCRSKKVKCDGRQPCIHCTVYLFKCTYDQPNVRNKKRPGMPMQSDPFLQAAAAAAATLSTFSPSNKMIISPSLIASLSGSNSNLENDEVEEISNSDKNGVVTGGSTVIFNLIQCQNILSVLLPKLKLNCLDETKPLNLDFDKLKKIANSDRRLSEINNLYLDEAVLEDSPSRKNSSDSPIGAEIKLIIPSKEVALQLIYVTWSKACVLFRFYHRPSLLEEVDLLYSLDPGHYGDRQQKFLPFLYSLLACGSLFLKTSNHNSELNAILEDDGYKYFLEARKLIDISNVGDIHSIQTIVMMIIYLQCSARLTTCYSYIGIAIRSALKEGLHRNLSVFHNSKRQLDPIEIDTRKRLFYTIYKMDIYINCLLGLPRSINEDEFDQELPAELDDENVTRDGYDFDKQDGALSSLGCANHHTKLMLILSHIVKMIYPVKVKKSSNLTPDHIHSKVTELEIELKAWLDNLPPELKPTDPSDADSTQHVPEKFLMANYYLHLAFLNCQIMLYRPFIHFISNGSESPKFKSSDPRSLIRGRNCIKVARMVVKLANKMIDQNLLVGTYWFSMYTIFFSIACLIYYFHFANYNINGSESSPRSSGANYAGILFDDDLSIDMIKKDIEIGKKVLDNLKNNSTSSLRIYNILNALFEHLNRRTATSSTQFKNQHFNGTALSPKDYDTSSVDTTIKSFDKINSFAKVEDAGVEPQFDFQRTSLNPNLKNRLSPFMDNITSLGRLHDLDSEPVQVNQVLGPTDLSSSDSNFSEDVNYLPGVFDTIDSQIFEKILPPYMMQGANSGGTEGVSSLNDPSGTQQYTPADFDFLQPDDENLDYLESLSAMNKDYN